MEAPPLPTLDDLTPVDPAPATDETTEAPPPLPDEATDFSQPSPPAEPPPLPEEVAGEAEDSDPEADIDPFAQPAPFEETSPVDSAALEDAARPSGHEDAFEGAAVPEFGAPAEETVEAVAETTAPPVQGFTFGKRDPTDKAKRLARVLVSDMIMYNAERHQTALAQGTLQQDFEEEIDKSWKEFVEQVGEELANGEGRRFWKDALNDILAKGDQIF